MKLKIFSHKKTFLMGILLMTLGVFVGGYLVLKSKFSQADVLEQLSEAIKKQDTSNDFDHDGLKDWEEEVYKTNPLKPDTDGDGYLDGEEVAIGFDPAIAAPNDQTVSNDEIPTGVKRPESGNLTQMFTFLLSQQVANNEISVSANATESELETAVNPKVVEALQKASANFLAEFTPPFQREQYNFFVSDQQNDEASIRQYLDLVKGRIKSMNAACLSAEQLDNPMGIIQTSIESRNFVQTDCLAKSYLNTYEELLALPLLPSSCLDAHITILSYTWNLSKTYQYLPQIETDPLKTIIVLQNTQEQLEKMKAIMNKEKND